jgi:hypothetical protein
MVRIQHRKYAEERDRYECEIMLVLSDVTARLKGVRGTHRSNAGVTTQHGRRLVTQQFVPANVTTSFASSTLTVGAARYGSPPGKAET